MRHAAERKGRYRPVSLSVAGLSVAVFLLVSCEPPGKPTPEPPPIEESLNFAELYGNNCAACHSADGKSGPGRPINNALYLSIIPKETLRSVIYYGRPGTAMPAWATSQGGPLSDKQIDVLVDGIETNWATSKGPKPADAPGYAATTAGDPAKGKKLFGRACFMCHAKGAAVGMVAEPTYLSLVSDQLLRTAIIEGWPEPIGPKKLAMPNYRTLNLGKPLSDQDVTDLVAYLSSLRPVAPNVQALHSNENGAGQQGPMTKGNEGSGNGPGSPEQRGTEGNRGKGSSSQGGGIK